MDLKLWLISGLSLLWPVLILWGNLTTARSIQEETNIKTGKILQTFSAKETKREIQSQADENIFLLWLCGDTTKKIKTQLGFWPAVNSIKSIQPTHRRLTYDHFTNMLFHLHYYWYKSAATTRGCHSSLQFKTATAVQYTSVLNHSNVEN